MPGAALAKGLKPKDAETKRTELTNAAPGDPRAAIDHLTRAGEELGDPELFLLAAERAYAEAERARDPELATLAEARALVAEDIGLYLSNQRNFVATDWQPVTRERAFELADHARTLAGEAVSLREAIERDRAAAEAERRRQAERDETPTERTKRELRPGTGLVIGGSAALVLGLGGLGLLGAGVALGQARQRDAEALVIPDQLDQLAELDRQGAQANTLAIVGGVVGGVGVGVGVALIVVGIKKRKAAGPGDAAGLGRHRVLMGGWIDRETGGLAVRGRF